MARWCRRQSRQPHRSRQIPQRRASRSSRTPTYGSFPKRLTRQSAALILASERLEALANQKPRPSNHPFHASKRTPHVRPGPKSASHQGSAAGVEGELLDVTAGEIRCWTFLRMERLRPEILITKQRTVRIEGMHPDGVFDTSVSLLPQLALR
jgi:hypothetical protein